MRSIDRRTLVATLVAGMAAGTVGVLPVSARTDEWEGPHHGLKLTWDDEFWEFSVGTTEEPVDWISIQGAGTNPYIVFHAEHIEVPADFYDDFEDEALELLHEYDQGDVEKSPPILEWADDDAVGYLFDYSFDDNPAYMCVEMSPVEFDGYALFTFYAVDEENFDEDESLEALDSVTVNDRDPFVGVTTRKIIRAIRKDLESR